MLATQFRLLMMPWYSAGLPLPVHSRLSSPVHHRSHGVSAETTPSVLKNAQFQNNLLYSQR